MSKKLRILSVISALCLLGSIACFSGYAVELANSPSGEEYAGNTAVTDPGTTYTDPGTAYTDPGYTYTDPGTAYTDPGTAYTDPGTAASAYVDPGTTTYTDPVVSYDPGYTDPGTAASAYDPGYTDPGYTEPTYSDTGANVVSDSTYQTYNYDNYSYNTTSYYIDYTSQYTQYIENTYQAKYDDNYYYVPSYTAPEESLIEIDSKEVDTDELTKDDWAKIMLALSDGDVNDSGTQTFSFIKNNNEEGDTSVDWMLYLGIVLIFMAVLTVAFVVITTNKANDKLKFA